MSNPNSSSRLAKAAKVGRTTAEAVAIATLVVVFSVPIAIVAGITVAAIHSDDVSERSEFTFSILRSPPVPRRLNQMLIYLQIERDYKQGRRRRPHEMLWAKGTLPPPGRFPESFAELVPESGFSPGLFLMPNDTFNQRSIERRRTSPTIQLSDCRLLNLPAEIRETIWKFCFEKDPLYLKITGQKNYENYLRLGVCACRKRAACKSTKPKCLAAPPAFLQDHLPLLRTCHQM